MEVVKAIEFMLEVLRVFLGEAILTSFYLINKILTKILGFETPFNLFLRFILIQKYFPQFY